MLFLIGTHFACLRQFCPSPDLVEACLWYGCSILGLEPELVGMSLRTTTPSELLDFGLASIMPTHRRKPMVISFISSTRMKTFFPTEREYSTGLLHLTVRNNTQKKMWRNFILVSTFKNTEYFTQKMF